MDKADLEQLSKCMAEVLLAFGDVRDVPRGDGGKRMLRLEFIKAAMQGILAHQNYDFPPEAYAQWAIRHAEATLAAAGEKGA